MSTYYLQIGVEQDLFMGDVRPFSIRMEKLIPENHEFLFQFIDFDLYHIESPVAEYLSCLDTGREPNTTLLMSAISALQKMHTYYMFCPENAALLMNRAFIGYIRRHFPDADEAEQKTLFRKVSIKKYSIYSNPDEIFSMAALPAASDDKHVIGCLFDLQKEIRRWVFVTLDDTNADLASLSTERRSALYSLVSSYNDVYPMLSFEAHFYTRPSKKMKHQLALWDFDKLPMEDSENESASDEEKSSMLNEDAEDSDEDNNVQAKVRQCLDELFFNPSASIPARLREAIKNTSDIDDSKEYEDDFDIITYDISSFSDLLKFEIIRMLAEKARIKRCKNCGKYFVLDKSNREYCSRVAPNSKKLCSEIGRSRVNTRKNAQDVSTPYALYRKAYKTHFARVAKGVLSQTEFDQWKTAALEKKTFVEAGKLDVADYEQWLRL